MKKVILAMLCFPHLSFSAELAQNTCHELYQSWVFNLVLEDACSFKRNVSGKLGVLTKNACNQFLTDEIKHQLGSQVIEDFRKEFDKLGEEALCTAQKSGYDSTSEALDHIIKK